MEKRRARRRARGEEWCMLGGFVSGWCTVGCACGRAGFMDWSTAQLGVSLLCCLKQDGVVAWRVAVLNGRASDVWSLGPLSVCWARSSLVARSSKNVSSAMLYSFTEQLCRNAQFASVVSMGW